MTVNEMYEVGLATAEEVFAETGTVPAPYALADLNPEAIGAARRALSNGL